MVWTLQELILNLWAVFKYLIALYTGVFAVTIFLRAAR